MRTWLPPAVWTRAEPLFSPESRHLRRIRRRATAIPPSGAPRRPIRAIAFELVPPGRVSGRNSGAAGEFQAPNVPLSPFCRPDRRPLSGTPAGSVQSCPSGSRSWLGPPSARFSGSPTVIQAMKRAVGARRIGTSARPAGPVHLAPPRLVFRTKESAIHHSATERGSDSLTVGHRATREWRPATRAMPRRRRRQRCPRSLRPRLCDHEAARSRAESGRRASPGP